MKTIVKVSAVLLSFICMSILGMEQINNKKRKIFVGIEHEQFKKIQIQEWDLLRNEIGVAQSQLDFLKGLKFESTLDYDTLAYTQLNVIKYHASVNKLAQKLYESTKSVYEKTYYNPSDQRLPIEIAIDIQTAYLSFVQKKLQEVDNSDEDTEGTMKID